MAHLISPSIQPSPLEDVLRVLSALYGVELRGEAGFPQRAGKCRVLISPEP